ncbi:FCGBP protein, partial [Chordeiles acutipennis]|nr:FCGBP protein [Chordeiles acutipennis]
GPTCPPNQHYELCGPSCPSTCRGQLEGEECEATTSCFEGCYCDHGFFKSGDLCVPLSHCGCLHQDRYYKLGDSFVPSPTCHQRCLCQEGGLVECQPMSCPTTQECAVRDGVRGCHPKDCGICQMVGPIFYVTFDGRTLPLVGSCLYTLAMVDTTTNLDDHLENFVVLVEKESGQEGPLVRRLLVTALGVTVALARDTQWEVTVDGERHLLPLSLADGALTVTQEGTHRVLQVLGGLKLLYDGDSYVLLTLPGTHRRRTQGICGNFNGDAADDWVTPEELGAAAWGTLTPSCNHGIPPTTCPTNISRSCDILMEKRGPFGGCH